MLKVALIGLGNMGSLHLRNLLSISNTGLCSLTCVCDVKAELAEQAGGDYQIHGYNNAEVLLESEQVDAAIIATTSSSHYELVKLFLRSRIPVLVEKPVVLSLDEAREISTIAREQKVLLSAGFTEVYNSVMTGAKSILSGKAEFDYMDFFRIGQKSVRNDTKDIDVVHDLMIHDIAALSQLIDLKRVRDVSGYFSAYNEHSGKYDTACATILFDTGKLVRFFCDRNGTTKIRKFTLSRDDLFGEFDYMDQTAQIFKKGRLEAFGDHIWYSQNYDAAKIRYSNNPLQDELQDFLTAVLQKKETIISPGWYEVTELVEGIRTSLYEKAKLHG